MTRRTESTPHPTTPLQRYEDVLVPLHPTMGLYLLRLITRDLEYLRGRGSIEWQEEIAAFALFLRDLLPAEFRIPVPTLPTSDLSMDGAKSAA